MFCNNCGAEIQPTIATCPRCGSVSGLISMSGLGIPRSARVRAVAIYTCLWVPAVLAAAIVTLAGLVTVLHAPMWSALSFRLALPAALVGLKSFRISAISMVALLLWDIVATTWPHINFSGLLESLIDVLLLTSTGMVLLVAVSSPFASVIGFVRQSRPR